VGLYGPLQATNAAYTQGRGPGAPALALAARRPHPKWGLPTGPPGPPVGPILATGRKEPMNDEREALCRLHDRLPAGHPARRAILPTLDALDELDAAMTGVLRR